MLRRLVFEARTAAASTAVLQNSVVVCTYATALTLPPPTLPWWPSVLVPSLCEFACSSPVTDPPTLHPDHFTSPIMLSSGYPCKPCYPCYPRSE